MSEQVGRQKHDHFQPLRAGKAHTPPLFLKRVPLLRRAAGKPLEFSAFTLSL